MSERKEIRKNFSKVVRGLFSLDSDLDNEYDTKEYIRQGVEFKGLNLWILIFAILVCSIGLNVNSTAVVIGAMLISPLMGPIIGTGLGIGIYDFELVKKGIKNLLIALIVSVLASYLYFLITPYKEITNELLARTTPNMYDVLIAFFGGCAGIVVASAKEKGNVLPGVAIATALMPPLCTAGYGLAIGNLNYFFGALYLFTINSVMISTAAFIVVRYLKFRPKEFLDAESEARVRRRISVLIFITVLPSLYTGYFFIQDNLFQIQARQYIKKELHFEGVETLIQDISYHGGGLLKEKGQPTIKTALVGRKVTYDEIDNARKNILNYPRLIDADLRIISDIDTGDIGLDLDVLRQGVIEDIYVKNIETLKKKNEEIALLKTQLESKKDLPTKDALDEVRSFYPQIENLAISQSNVYFADTTKIDTTLSVLLGLEQRKKLSKQDLERLEKWFSVKFGNQKVRLVVQ